MSTDLITIIQSRLQQAFSPTFVEVLDESKAHEGHAGHQKGDKHFVITIAAPLLKNISRVEAHRQIYALLTDIMPHPVHALKIKILLD